MNQNGINITIHYVVHVYTYTHMYSHIWNMMGAQILTYSEPISTYQYPHGVNNL